MHDRKMVMKKYKVQISGFLIGGIAGYFYYSLIGCKTGACPLTGNAYISTLFGGIFGLLLVDVIKDLFRPKKSA